MEWKETLKKYWWIGAIILLFLLLRSRQSGGSTTARLAAVEGATPTSDGILDQTIQRLAVEEAQRHGRMQAAQEKLAMQGMEQQAKLLQAQTGYQLSIFEGQKVLQDKLVKQAKSAPFACPDGKAKINPETGQLYCRVPKGGGLTLGNLFKRAVDIAPQIIAGMVGMPSVGTPPIVPWNVNEQGGAF